MVVSTQQLTSYSTSLYNASPTLLPENIASFITAIALTARLSLRCSSLLIEALLESVKHSTSFSFGLSRQALINALSTAKRLHELTAPSSSAVITSDHISSDSLDHEKYTFKKQTDEKKINHFFFLEMDFYKCLINTQILAYILFIIHLHLLNYLPYLVFNLHLKQLNLDSR